MTVSFEAASAHNVTLTNGGLTVTNTGTTSTDQGAHTPTSDGRTSGLLYFEATIVAAASGTSSDLGIGIGTTASTFANIGNSATVGNVLYVRPGTLWANGSNSGFSLTARAVGDVIGFAINLSNRNIWVKKVNSLTTGWNSSSSGSSNDPAGNVGGCTVPAGTMFPFAVFGGSGGVASDSFTFNFAGPFIGTIPAGFSAWDAAAVGAGVVPFNPPLLGGLRSLGGRFQG